MENDFIDVNNSQDLTVISQNNHKSLRVWLIGLAVIIFLFLLVPILVGGARLYNGIAGADSHFQSASNALVGLDFETANSELDIVLSDINKAESGINFLFILNIVPNVGHQIKVTDILLKSSYASIEAEQEVIVVAENIKNVLEEADLTIPSSDGIDNNLGIDALSDKQRIDFLSALHNSSDQLIDVLTRLELAENQIAKIKDYDDINSTISNVASTFEEKLIAIISTVKILVPISQVLDEVAGINETKQWLILFLNNTEIRPGGGFIGVYGLAQIKGGEIQDIYTADSYSIDRLVENSDYSVTPPRAISDYLGIQNWYFRDANWSPDFEESSKIAVQLLRQEYSYAGLPVPDIKGVIGITPTLVEQMLEVTGPITVHDIEFTSENVTEKLEYYVEFGYEDVGSSWDERKDIVGELMDEMMSKLLSLPFNKFNSVLSMIHSNFQQKQIIIYSGDDKIQKVFEDYDWAGNIDSSVTDDVLMVVDSNMGALKTDNAVSRDIGYSINNVDGSLYATVDVNYIHNGNFDWRTSQYQTYTRVYAPLGSELTTAYLSDQPIDINNINVVDELGMTSFGTYFKVYPNTTEKLSLVYKLPDSVINAVDDKIYQLTVLKQLGSDNYPLTIKLDFGKKLSVAKPAEDISNFGDDIYSIDTILDHDLVFTVQF